MVSTINKWIVQEYCEAVKDQGGVVLISMEGLSVEKSIELRNQIRSSGAQLLLGKKRLVKVALSEAGIEFDDVRYSFTHYADVGGLDTSMSFFSAAWLF